jgi:hypothetical protein
MTRFRTHVHIEAYIRNSGPLETGLAYLILGFHLYIPLVVHMAFDPVRLTR